MQADNSPGASRRRPRKRRWLLFALALFLFISLIGLIGLRLHLDDWVRSSIEQRIGARIDGELRIGDLELELTRLAAHIRDVELTMRRESGGTISLSIPEGVARLTMDGLLGLSKRKVHLAELTLARPRLQTTDRWLKRPGERESREPLQIDMRIDSLRVREGSWAHASRETRIDFAVDNLDLQGSWSGDRRSVVGRISVETALLTPALDSPIDLGLATDFRWRGLQVDFMDTIASGAGLEIELESQLLIGSPAELQGQGKVVADLDSLNSSFSNEIPEIGGRAHGQFDLLVTGPDWSVEGDFVADEAHFSVFEAERAAAHARYVPGRLELTQLSADAYDGEVAGRVTALVQAPATFDVDIEGRQLGSSELLELLELPLPLSSRVDTRFELGGEAADRRTWDGGGEFSATGPGAGMDGLPVRGGGEFTFDKGRLRLRAEQSEIADAVLDFSMDLDLTRESARGHLHLDGETMDARRTQLGTLRILEALGAEENYLVALPLRGVGEIDARIGLEEGNILDLTLGLESGGWGDIDFDRGELKLSLDEEAVIIHGFDIEHGRERATGSGRWKADAELPSAFEMTAEGVGLQSLLPILEMQADVDGRLSGQLSIGEDEHGLRGSGRFSIVDGEFLGEKFEEANAFITIERGEVKLAPCELHGITASGRGELVWVPSASTARIDLAEGFLELGAMNLVRARDLPLAGRLELSGSLEMAESGVQGALVVSGTDWDLMGQPMREVSGEVEIAHDEVALSLHGPGRTGWKLDAVVGMSDDLPIEASLHLDQSIFDPFKDLTPPVWAKLSGSVSLQGSLARTEELVADGLLRDGEIFLGAHRFTLEEELPIRLRSRRLELAGIRLSGPRVDFDGDFSWDMESGAIEGAAGGALDLRVISAFAPDIRGAGRVTLDIEFGGSIDAPDIEGEIAVEKGRLRWLPFPQTVEQIDMKLVFDGSEARIDRFQALAGGGEVTGSAGLRLGRGGVESYRAELFGTNVRLSWPEDFEGVYDGGLQLTGGDGHSLLRGRVEMLRGLYAEEFDLAGALGFGAREYAAEDQQSIPEHISLDVDIAADGGLWIRNDMAEIENGFNLHVGGNLRRPELTGRLWMHEGGELEFREVKYSISSGSLDFVEIDRINPYLVLRAETTVGDHEVYLRVEGTMERFEYELTSLPSLSQQDIIALLMTGRTLQELTTEGRGGGADFTGDLAANYFAGALTGKFEKQLERLLGLDRVQINPMLVQGSADPTTRVTLGEKVSEDIFVIFSTDVGSTERQLYQVEWKATPRQTFTAERDTTGGLGGDYLYRDRYWWKKRPEEREKAELSPSGPAVSEIVEGPPVSAIRLLGVDDETASALLKRIPLRPGDPFLRSKMFAGVEAIRRYFIRQGRIEAKVDSETPPVLEGGGALALIYRVDPGPRTRIHLEGADKKERRRLRLLLENLWAESLFNESLYADSERLIREYFQERGYYAVDVQHSLGEEEGERKLTFRIDKGKSIRVEQVIILGAKQVPEERVRRQILTGSGSLFSRKLLTPSVLEQDLIAIRNLYLDSGHLRINLSEPRIRLAADAGSAEVTIVIDEGPRFTVGEITFSEGLPFERERLHGWCALGRGELFSPERLLEASGGLRSGFDREGYPDARVNRVIEIAEERVRIRFEVEPGGRKRVGEVEISGNLLTKRHSIVRELELAKGDLISREKLLRSQHRLYKLGAFRNVRMSYSPLEEGDGELQRLQVKVDEAPPLGLSLGIGYDTEAGPRARFSTTHDNLGGRVRTVAIQGHFSDILQRAQILGTEPRLFGRRLPALASLFWEHREEIGFTVDRRSTALRIDREFNPRWSGYMRYNWQKIDLSDVEDEVALLEEKLENIRLGDIGLTLVRSTRDNPITPSRGSLFSINTRLFSEALLSDASFLKSTLTASHVLTLRNETSFATAVRLGLSKPFSDTDRVPLSERFFLGGDSTLRGFPRDGVDPVGEDGLLGGEAMLLFNQEYRFPIWGSLRGVLFYDVGNLYADISDMDLSELRHVLGVGLRYSMPIGPLRLEYGRKLDREEGESSGELFIAIGGAF